MPQYNTVYLIQNTENTSQFWNRDTGEWVNETNASVYTTRQRHEPPHEMPIGGIWYPLLNEVE